jgi:hypothetical protein
MRTPLPVNENLDRKNITFSPTYQLIKIVVKKRKRSYKTAL